MRSHLRSHLGAREDPSRTTPDGGVLLFESRANLAGYDPEGHAEIYRYDVAGERTRLPLLQPDRRRQPARPASSRSSRSLLDPEPLSSYAFVANLSADGRRAFFQSTEALVLGDTDGLLDVYEWEDQGVGGCNASRRLRLPDLLRSQRPDRLPLRGQRQRRRCLLQHRRSAAAVRAEETASIYDARVGGGFAEPAEGSARAKAAGPATPPPAALRPPKARCGRRATSRRSKPCPKGKRKVKRQRQGPLRQEDTTSTPPKSRPKKKGAGK